MLVDSLKALDPNRPIREADMAARCRTFDTTGCATTYIVAALDQGDRMKWRSFTMRRRTFMQRATAGLFVPVDTVAQKRRRIGLLIPGIVA